MSNFFKRNNISMIVSDMAGTTINESGIIYQSIFNTLHKMGYPVKVKDKQNWHGMDKKEAMINHILKYDPNIDTQFTYKTANRILLNELSREYFDNNNIDLIDNNLSRYFNNLRNDNIIVTLQTGYPSILQEKIIHKFKMNCFIDDWISSQHVKRGRPYPDMIEFMTSKYNINSKNVAKIGDTVNDMKEGKNAHCGIVIGVLTGEGNRSELIQAGADIIVDKITDL